MQKIVLTGGPCAGKSSALKAVKEHLVQKGYIVYIIHETATELIKSGVDNKRNQRIFQPAHVELQIAKEDIIESIAEKEYGFPMWHKIIFLCDRGAIDAHAFCSDEDFAYVQRYTGYYEEDMLNRYDAVFHLDTAPKSSYTLANNEARSETPSEAQEVNERNFRVWKRHPYLVRIGNEDSFDKKIEKLLHAIDIFLGETKATDKDWKDANHLWFPSILRT